MNLLPPGPAGAERLPADRSLRPRIVLLGLRGAGKTTVGALLADRLSLPFHDSDAVLAARGAAPGPMIRDRGLPAFREAEAQVVRDLAARPHGVLALGGGAIETGAVRAALAGWRAVLLVAPDATLAARISAVGAADRPSLTDLPLAEEIAQLRERRAPLYTSLDPVMIATGEKDAEAVVAEIIATLGLASDGGIGSHG